jgi:predicted ATP-grasp superfamily ATP-dependent carboligase
VAPFRVPGRTPVSDLQRMQPETWAREINAAWKRTRTRPAIVLCAAFSGLAIARSLGRRGVPVFAVDSRCWEVGMHSRYARPLTLPDPSANPETWVGFLLAAGRRFECRPVLFAAGDPHLTLLSCGRDALGEFYEFCIPRRDVLELLLDKRRQYRYLLDHGVDLPQSRMPESPAQAVEDAREIGFPCLAKPAVSHRWVAASGAKLVVVSDPDQAGECYRAMTAAGSGFLLQQLIGGGDDQLYGALCYFDRQGSPLATATKRKLKQYPERFGNGSVQISVHQPDLADHAQQVLRQLGYVGFGSVEYKLDPRDRKMKLIEINPRPVSGLQIAIDSGTDLPWLAYEDLTGVAHDPLPSPRAGVLFVNESWELQRVWRTAPYSPVEWMRFAVSVARARSLATLSLRDPGPALSLVRRALANRRRTPIEASTGG